RAEITFPHQAGRIVERAPGGTGLNGSRHDFLDEHDVFVLSGWWVDFPRPGTRRDTEVKNHRARVPGEPPSGAILKARQKVTGGMRDRAAGPPSDRLGAGFADSKEMTVAAA